MIGLARTKQDKELMVQELTTKFSGSTVVILTNYRGLTVGQITELRRRLREENVEYKVVKNSMALRAAASSDMGELGPLFKGPVALAFGSGDPAMVAKILSGYARESRILELLGGWLEGRSIGAAEVKTLAELPGRQELLARVVGGIAAPLTGFAAVCAGPIRQLMTALTAIGEQKDSGAAA